MKSKQLANVLLKILGLYICLYAIPSFLIGIVFAMFPFSGPSTPSWNAAMTHLLSYALIDVVRGVVGVLIIIKSQKIADLVFKNEEE